MSTFVKNKLSSSTTTSTVSLLEQAVNATKQTEPDQAKALLRVLTQNALKGTVQWDRNVVKTLNNAREGIDQIIS